MAAAYSGGKEIKKQVDKIVPDITEAKELLETEEAPVADDSAVKIANRRKASRRRAGGRAGTILTEGSTLG